MAGWLSSRGLRIRGVGRLVRGAVGGVLTLGDLADVATVVAVRPTDPTAVGGLGGRDGAIAVQVDRGIGGRGGGLVGSSGDGLAVIIDVVAVDVLPGAAGVRRRVRDLGCRAGRAW